MMPDSAALESLANVFNLESNSFIRYLVGSGEMDVRSDFDRKVVTLFQDWYRSIEQNRRALLDLLEDEEYHVLSGPWPLHFAQYNFLVPTYLLNTVVRIMEGHLEELRRLLGELSEWTQARDLVNAIIDREVPYLERTKQCLAEAPREEPVPPQVKGTSASRW